MTVVVRCEMCGREVESRGQTISLRVGRNREYDFDCWDCVAQFVNRQLERAKT